MAAPPHSLRFVDVEAWDPSSPEWHALLRQLPMHEQQQVARFMFAKDQKLALASRLLQRHLIHELFGVDYDAIDIARTPENVSHHGTIVAIVSDSRALVGVDVARITDRPNQKTSVDEFFRAFADHFNPGEWRYIRETEDEDDQYSRFYRLWSLKEAYIKAVGIGLGFSLLRAEFIREQLEAQDLALCVAATAVSSGVRAENEVAENPGLLGVPGLLGATGLGYGAPGYGGGPAVSVGVPGLASVGVGNGGVGVSANVLGLGALVGVDNGGVGNGAPGYGVPPTGVYNAPAYNSVPATAVNSAPTTTTAVNGASTAANANANANTPYSTNTVTSTNVDGTSNTASVSNGNGATTGGASASATAGLSASASARATSSQKAYRQLRSVE
ncbi:hypothetical protein PF003_g27732 [Phytophthora fragariae]|nr:hypothetical protein PF003_g27732 [Phytophthora fragariae]